MSLERDSTKRRVIRFLNSHPLMSLKGTQKRFKDVGDKVVLRYYYEWQWYIEPLRWLYGHMVKKWTPMKQLSKKDGVRLRKVERMLEGEKV